ncbi:MAG: hypothetical protein DHS20C13_12250 [Thermodesulfobacteriota bacterium]|nr:MAG: hypothetical protein DHS20C13_12250 [Thermodesulfobacteriota bacterium]
MGYENNFKLAQNKAQDIVDSLPDGSFALITALIPNNDKEHYLSEDKNLLRKSINEIELSSTFTDNQKRLEDIYSRIQKSPNEKKKVILITDFQKNGWKDEVISTPWLELVNVSKASNISNHAVSDIALNYTNDLTRIQSRISNFSDDSVKELLAITQLDGEEVSEFVDIEPQESSVMEASFTNENKLISGTGYVETTHDNLKIDDIRHFISNYKEESNILIVDGDPREDSRLSETYYLARALETISENSATTINITDNDTVLNEDLSQYDLIYLANIGDITPSFANQLEQFIIDGGTAVIFLGNRVRIGYYNTLFENILPGELLSIIEGDLSLIPSNSLMFSKDIINRTDQISVDKLFQISIHPESRVLIKATDETPFLINKELGKGNVFTFSSSADSAWSNFSITPVFLPVIKMINDLPNIEGNKNRHHFVGEPVKIEIVKDKDSTAVIGPTGKEYVLNIESNEFQNTWLPGIYTVETDGEIAYKFAVNINPKESNLEKISIPSIEKELEVKGKLVKVFKELWRYFVWGVLALFVSEAVCRGIFSKY